MKDWTGNKKTTFVTLGASNHSDKERESNDYYATDPKSLEKFLNSEHFSFVLGFTNSKFGLLDREGEL